MKTIVKPFCVLRGGLMAALLGLPLFSACSSSEPPKTTEQIEESRAKHQKISRKEWEG